MTKIFKYQDDIDVSALKELEKCSSIAIDTEGSGLQIPHRDKLSLVQFSTGNNDAYIIQPNRKNYKAPNIVKILENSKTTTPIAFIFEAVPSTVTPRFAKPSLSVSKTSSLSLSNHLRCWMPASRYWRLAGMLAGSS